MNSTLIFTFLAVARTKNISNAACELNQVQSTISKRLKQLEENVGHVLFNRKKGTKNISLTPEGEVFMNFAEQWIRLHEELERLQQPQHSFELKIAGVDSLNSSYMKQMYRDITQRESDIRLTITTYFLKEMYAAIAERKGDVAFSFYYLEHSSLHVKQLYTEPMIGLSCANTRSVWLPEAVPLASLDPRREVYAPWANAHDIWRKTYLNIAEPPCITVYPVSQLTDFLDEPDKWCIVPQSYAAHVLREKPLRVFNIHPAPPPRTCYYIVHKHPISNAQRAIRTFEKYLFPLLTTIFGEQRNGDSTYMADIKQAFCP